MAKIIVTTTADRNKMLIESNDYSFTLLGISTLAEKIDGSSDDFFICESLEEIKRLINEAESESESTKAKLDLAFEIMESIKKESKREVISVEEF